MNRGQSQRLFYTVLAVVCAAGILSLIWVAPASATDADEDLNVSVSADDKNVWVGGSVDLSITVQNDVNKPYLVDTVTIVDGDGTVHAQRDIFNFRVGGENPEDTVRFNDITVDDTGITEFRAVLAIEKDRGRAVETIEKSIKIEVSNPEPVVDLTAEPALSGTERTVSLAVGNPHNESLRRIEADLAGPDAMDIDIVNPRDVITSLGPSERKDLKFTVRDVPVGTHEFNVSLRYETSDGESWETMHPVSVDFPDQGESVQIGLAEASVIAAPNGVRLNGSLYTEGNITAQNVRITPVDEQGVEPTRPSPQAYINSVERQGTGSFDLTASLGANRKSIPLQIQYQIDGVAQSTTVSVPYEGPRNIPPVQLTNLNIAGSNSVSISGELANTRESPVTGVTVRIAEKNGVSPGDSGEFFAGSIDSGTFTPLERISATVSGDRDTIPVELSYVYKGTQYTSVVELDHKTGGQSGVSPGGGQGGSSSLPEFDAGTDGGGGSGSSLPADTPQLVGGILVTLALVAGAVVYRRRS